MGYGESIGHVLDDVTCAVFLFVTDYSRHDRQSQWGMAKFDPQPTLSPLY